jgi:hypothetical protein
MEFVTLIQENQAVILTMLASALTAAGVPALAITAAKALLPIILDAVRDGIMAAEQRKKENKQAEKAGKAVFALTHQAAHKLAEDVAMQALPPHVRILPGMRKVVSAKIPRGVHEMNAARDWAIGGVLNGAKSAKK